MKRRQFIISGASLSAVAYLCGLSEIARAASKASVGTPYLLVSDAEFNNSTNIYTADSNAHVASDVAGKIVFKNLKTGVVSSYDVPTWAHVFNQHPQQSNIFVGCGKWVPSAVAFDFKNKKTLAAIHAPEDYLFFGHACFSPDGKFVYFSAHSNSKNKGVLCAYSCDDWSFKKMVDSGGQRPHECLITPNNQLCVVNTKGAKGSSGNLSFFDANTLESIDSIPIPIAAHMVYTDNNHAFLGGFNVSSEMMLFHLDLNSKKIINIHDSKLYPKDKIQSESLSLIPLSKNTVAVTLLDANQLMIWNIKSNTFQLINVPPGVLGLAKLDNKLFLNCKNAGELMEFSIEEAAQGTNVTLNPQPESHLGNGRHMRLVYI